MRGAEARDSFTISILSSLICLFTENLVGGGGLCT
jgi:hypothetical protein